MCLCPAHDDRAPSLHVTESEGKILVHCFAGCSNEAVIEALRARNLWVDLPSDSKPTPHRPKPQQQTPIKKASATIPQGIFKTRNEKTLSETWAYKDEAGKVLGHVARYDGNGKKEIIPYFNYKNGRWTPGAPKAPRPLYALNHIARAPQDLTIWIVEGEKCAEALQSLPPGVRRLTTTSMGGTNAARFTDWSPLAGRKVRIWPDYDQPGKKYAEEVKLQLKGLMPPPTIEIVDTAKLGLKEKEDVYDWLQIHKPEELDRIPLIGKSLAEQDTWVDVPEFVLMDIPDIEMILDPWLPTQGLCMIHAKRGAGKTLITCEIAYAIAAGIKFLNWEAPKPRGVVYIDGEMSAKELQERFVKIIANHNGQAPAKRLRLYAAGLNIHGTPNIGTAEGQKRINAGITDDIELVIIDSLSVLQRGCDEDKSSGWEPMQQWLLQLKGLGKAVLLIHHSGKSGEQRGASKREDFMNTVISLKEHAIYSQEEGAKFEIRFEKGRNLYGPKARSIDVEFIGTDWVYKDMKGAIREQIIRALKDEISQKEIAGIFKVSKQYISKIKKEAGFEGEL